MKLSNEESYGFVTLLALLLFTFIYTLLFAWFGYDRWGNLMTTWTDFATIDSAAWQTANGSFMRTSTWGNVYWGDHFSPILLLLSGWYLLFDDHLFVFVWQGLSVGLTVAPLYLIAAEFLHDRRTASLLALSYPVAAMVVEALLFDYHMASHMGLFALSAFYALMRRRWGWFALFGVLLAICREDAAIILFMFGFYALASNERRAAIFTWIGSAGYLALVFLVLIPAFRQADSFTVGDPSHYQYLASYLWLGESFSSITKSFLTAPWGMGKKLFHDPARLSGWFELAASTGFLPLLSPIGLLMAAPTSLSLLLNYRPATYGLTLHYPLLVAPLWWLAAIMGLTNLKRLLGRRLSDKAIGRVLLAIPLLLLVGNLLHSSLFADRSCLPRTPISEGRRAHASAVHAGLALLPKSATVQADPAVITLLTHQTGARMLTSPERGKVDADYVALSAYGARDDRGRRVIRELIESLMADPAYETIYSAGGFFLFAATGRDRTPASGRRSIPGS